MSQRNLFWPLGVITVFLLVMAAALTNPPETALRAQSDPCREGYPVYPVCVTQTAQANPNAATNTPTPTSSPTPTTTTTTVTTSTTAAGTATAATAATGTPGGTPTIAATATRAATATPRATRDPNSVTPTLTPTLEIVGDVIACTPGEAVEFEGEGPPNSALLLYFNRRAVGGGLTGADGRYLLRMVVGTERPGFYLVSIQLRDTREVLRELTCEIGGTTPTPTEEGF